jgi:histidine kinase-like protein
MELLGPALLDAEDPSGDQLPDDRDGPREAGPRGADEGPQVLARHIDLDDDSSSPRRARLFVDEASRDWGCDEVRDDAVLVASELVGNAVAHARTSCRLDIRLDRLGLTIAVRDYDARGPLVPLACSATGHRDHGLFLVASICRAWGVSPTENGKSVWALLPVPEG